MTIYLREPLPSDRSAADIPQIPTAASPSAAEPHVTAAPAVAAAMTSAAIQSGPAPAAMQVPSALTLTVLPASEPAANGSPVSGGVATEPQGFASLAGGHASYVDFGWHVVPSVTNDPVYYSSRGADGELTYAGLDYDWWFIA